MTQIYLVSQDFAENAKCLDNKRLNKQITEAKQVYTANRYGFGKQGNPSPYEMWKGYENQLLLYGMRLYDEWIFRLDNGFRGGVAIHKAGEFFCDEIDKYFETNIEFWNQGMPQWFSDKRIFSSYRAALLDKDFAWYSQFGWTERPDIPDVDKKGNKHYHYVYGKGK